MKHISLLLLTAAIGLAQDAARIVVTRTEAAITTEITDPSTGRVTTTKGREVLYQGPGLRVRQEIYDGAGNLKQVHISGPAVIGLWVLDPARNAATQIAGGPGSTASSDRHQEHQDRGDLRSPSPLPALPPRSKRT